MGSSPAPTSIPAKATAEVAAAASGSGASAVAQAPAPLSLPSVEKVKPMSNQVLSSFEEVAAFHKDNVEAVVASSSILAKGFEALSKDAMAFAQGRFEQSVGAAKAAFAVKSLKELVDLQADFAKASFDAFLQEATRISEVGMKVANEAANPIAARVTAASEKMGKTKAA
jgi:phasin family protein